MVIAVGLPRHFPSSRTMSAEDKIAELKLELPPVPKPQGVYKPVVIVGNLVYVSGHGPLQTDKTLILGRVGADLDLESGKRAARQVGLAMLATLRDYLGGLNRVRRLVKTLGLVNCTPDFHQHPAVINGFSELMAEVFGAENGIGARSAVGAPSLPGNMAVEVEAIFEIDG
jgi:enamine deaminase RidA (YjgF/YER057c/UK114 family)